MLTRILHNSVALCTFLDHLGLELSKPQRQHILNMADALLTCESEKTLAALQRQFVEAPDPSNMADCLRISPWSATDVRAAIRVSQLKWLIEWAEQQGLPHTIDSIRNKKVELGHVDLCRIEKQTERVSGSHRAEGG
jgi:hypothetical protein